MAETLDGRHPRAREEAQLLVRSQVHMRIDQTRQQVLGVPVDHQGTGLRPQSASNTLDDAIPDDDALSLPDRARA
jgi:hypothetical protein